MSSGSTIRSFSVSKLSRLSIPVVIIINVLVIVAGPA